MFSIHADSLEQQLFLANNGPNTAAKMNQPQKRVPGKMLQQFPRRAALGDVSNQRVAQQAHLSQQMQKPMALQHMNRQQREQPAPKQMGSWEAPLPNRQTSVAGRQPVHAGHADPLRDQTLEQDAHAKEQVYMREQQLAQEQAMARAQAVAWARQQHDLHQKQQHLQHQQQQMMMQAQMQIHAPTPMRKQKKKKRTARRQPVVANYNPCLSPLVENVLGELPTPARVAYMSGRQVDMSPSRRGLLNFSTEVLVTSDNAAVGNHAVVSSHFASVPFFRKYAGKIGVLIRKSEAPGGCGWIVDFGTNLGRQFFSTGGPGNVCHLAFATLVAPSSPVALAPTAETAKSPMMLSIVRRVMSPISASAEAAGWAVREVPSSEEALRNLIGLSRNLKGMAPENVSELSARVHLELQQGSMLSVKISEQASNLSSQVETLMAAATEVESKSGEKDSSLTIPNIAENATGNNTEKLQGAAAHEEQAHDEEHDANSKRCDADKCASEPVKELPRSPSSYSAWLQSAGYSVAGVTTHAQSGAHPQWHQQQQQLMQYHKYTAQHAHQYQVATGSHAQHPQHPQLHPQQHPQQHPPHQYQQHHPHHNHNQAAHRTPATSTGPFGTWGANANAVAPAVTQSTVQRQSPKGAVSKLSTFWDTVNGRH